MGILSVLDKSTVLMSKNMLYVAKPLTTISKFEEDKTVIDASGRPLLFFDNVVYDLRSYTTTDRLFEEIKREVSLAYEEEYSVKIEKFLKTATTILTMGNAELLSRNRVYPIVYKNELLLCKEILPYTIKTGRKAYDFTGCTIYVHIGANGEYTPPAILSSTRYVHPHVFPSNQICLGDYKCSNGLNGAVKALNQTEQILVSGYDRNGAITSSTFTEEHYPSNRGGFI